MSRYGPVLFAAAIAAVAAVVLALVLRPTTVSAPSPSASATAAPMASPTTSPAASPTATPARSPSPSATVATSLASPSSPGGRYVSALLGYSIELPPPWHRSACSGPVTQQHPTPMGEVFFGVSPRDWTGTDIGVSHPGVNVFAEENPQGLSPRQWAESGRTGGTLAGQRIEDVTYAGRPAARQSVPDSVPRYFVANGDRMYAVASGAQPGQFDAATRQTMARIIESFRFITPAEQAAARAALPTAPPPRTPEQVADGVAAAFAAKNADALAAFLGPCVATFGEQAGGTSVSREKYVDDLRAAFAAGLVVTVRARPFEGDRATGNFTIGSTWQDPRATVERKLMLRGGLNERWEWHGTLERFR